VRDGYGGLSGTRRCAPASTAGLRVDAQPVGAGADRNALQQPPADRADRVDLRVVAADSHSTLPSADTPPMSGLPPPGCATSSPPALPEGEHRHGALAAVRDVEIARVAAGVDRAPERRRDDLRRGRCRRPSRRCRCGHVRHVEHAPVRREFTSCGIDPALSVIVLTIRWRATSSLSIWPRTRSSLGVAPVASKSMWSTPGTAC